MLKKRLVLFIVILFSNFVSASEQVTNPSPFSQATVLEKRYSITNDQLTPKKNFPEGGHVTISLVIVPPVIGHTHSRAESELIAAGFTVRVKIQASDSVVSGNVMGQYPASGYAVVEGSTVNIIVSNDIGGSAGISKPIPTLSFWGLLALSGLMPAVLSFMSRRRYRQ